MPGEVIGECKKPHRQQEFLSLLRKLKEEKSKKLDLLLIFDNSVTHKHEKVKAWLKRNKRVHLHFITFRLSWLNLVERFIGLLTEKQLKGGVSLLRG